MVKGKRRQDNARTAEGAYKVNGACSVSQPYAVLLTPHRRNTRGIVGHGPYILGRDPGSTLFRLHELEPVRDRGALEKSPAAVQWRSEGQAPRPSATSNCVSCIRRARKFWGVLGWCMVQHAGWSLKSAREGAEKGFLPLSQSQRLFCACAWWRHHREQSGLTR